MDASLLVGPDLQGGAQLLAKLDHQGMPIIAAFWCYPTSHSDWRLVIASPLIDTAGSLQAYDQIVAALDQLPEARISSMVIYAVGEDDPVVRYLRRTLTAGAVTQNFNTNAIYFDFGAYAPYLPEDEYSLRVFVYRIVLQPPAETPALSHSKAPA